MRWSGLHSGGVNGFGRSTWMSKLILRRLGIKRAKVVEKLEIRWHGRRSFSAKTLLQVYGLKIGMVDSTLSLGSKKVLVWRKSNWESCKAVSCSGTKLAL